MYSLRETIVIFSHLCTTSRHHTLNFFVFADVLQYKWSLHGKLSRWHENQSLNLIKLNINFVTDRYSIRSSFTCSILCFGDDVFSFQGSRNSLFLNRGREFIPHFEDTLRKKYVNLVIFKRFCPDSKSAEFWHVSRIFHLQIKFLRLDRKIWKSVLWCWLRPLSWHACQRWVRTYWPSFWRVDHLFLDYFVTDFLNLIPFEIVKNGIVKS